MMIAFPLGKKDAIYLQTPYGLSVVLNTGLLPRQPFIMQATYS